MNQIPKQITWQFVTGNSAASELIRWKTDSEISHVNVVTPDGKLLGALQDGGVEVRDFNYDHFSLQILVTLTVTDEQYAKFWQYANSKVGTKYDSKGILGITLGNNDHDSNKVFCSEYQSDGIVFAEIFRIAKATSKIDPETLRLLLMAQPGATEQRIQ